MPAAFYERPGWQAQPGLHALIVGISAYRDLPTTSDLLQPAHCEMLQLQSPALTAFRLATLLEKLADRLAVPLATCRVLLAPSAAELAAEPGLATFAAPDFVNFSVEAKAWRADALAARDGMTLFYFAGHGLQRVRRDHVLVLHNFNDGIGGSLSSKGVNVDQLIDGMAASAGQEGVARTQLYFFDTCRVRPGLFTEVEIMSVGSFWDVKKVPDLDDRVRPTFYAAKPGGTAFAKPGKETLFGNALLRCLEGGAGRPAEKADHDCSDWIVSLDSLKEGLDKHIDLANRDESAAQEMLPEQGAGDFVLVRLEERPRVNVSLRIDPGMAAALAKVSVVDDDNRQLRDLAPFDPNPLEMQLPAGYLRISAIVDPENPALRPRLRRTFVLEPPVTNCPLDLSR